MHTYRKSHPTDKVLAQSGKPFLLRFEWIPENRTAGHWEYILQAVDTLQRQTFNSYPQVSTWLQRQ